MYKKALPGLLFLSIVWPASAFALAAGKIWEKQYHIIILIFSFWFGYYVNFYSGDILRFEKAYHEIAQYSWSDYFYLVGNFSSLDKLSKIKGNSVNSKPDIYALSLQFFISRFTENSRWFFAFVSLFYTFFFLKFLDEVLLVTGKVNKPAWYLFLWSLVLIVPFYVGVTGVRFWTALFVFMWFAMKFMRTGRYINIAWAGASALIHYTFLFPLAILLVFPLLRAYKWLSIIIIPLSIGVYFVSSNTEILKFLIENQGAIEETAIGDASAGYLSEDLLEGYLNKSTQVNWYVSLRTDMVFYFFIFIFLLESLGVFRWITDKYLDKSYVLCVLFFAISIVTMELGSMNRFKYVFFLLIAVRLLYLVKLNPSSFTLKLVAFSLAPIMVFYTIINFRGGLYFVDPLLLIGNPMSFMLMHSGTSLSEFLVGH